MKNAQKQKQQQQQQHHLQHHHQTSWQHLNGVGPPVDGSGIGGSLYSPLSAVGGSSQPQRCYSPFESLQYGLSGSQEYGGNSPSASTSYFPISSPSTVSAIGSERSQARAQAAAAMSAGTEHSCRRLFGGTSSSVSVGSCGGGPCCDDSPGGPFYDGLGAGSSSANHKYDDLSFLQNLQPGQRLNSEVSSHFLQHYIRRH